mgnify:CR=1 FL=1
MLEYYEKLLQLKCFSHAEAIRLLGDERKTSNILYALKKKGLVQSVRRNLYVVISLETKEPVASPFELAALITGQSYISHHSAFEYYGMANQVFADVYVSSPTKFREFDFDDRKYLCYLTQNNFGIVEKGLFRVTDLERTVLDSIKDFDKIGGLEELLRCLAMITVIKEEKLMDYLGRYQNQFLFQKTGYLLSRFPQLKLSTSFFSYCKEYRGKSSRYLYKDLQDEPCVFLKEWNLCVPENLMDLTNEGGDFVV